jgi:hypothetical protein
MERLTWLMGTVIGELPVHAPAAAACMTRQFSSRLKCAWRSPKLINYFTGIGVRANIWSDACGQDGIEGHGKGIYLRDHPSHHFKFVIHIWPPVSPSFRVTVRSPFFFICFRPTPLGPGWYNYLELHPRTTFGSFSGTSLEDG